MLLNKANADVTWARVGWCEDTFLPPSSGEAHVQRRQDKAREHFYFKIGLQDQEREKDGWDSSPKRAKVLCERAFPLGMGEYLNY